MATREPRGADHSGRSAWLVNLLARSPTRWPRPPPGGCRTGHAGGPWPPRLASHPPRGHHLAAVRRVRGSVLRVLRRGWPARRAPVPLVPGADRAFLPAGRRHRSGAPARLNNELAGGGGAGALAATRDQLARAIPADWRGSGA